MFCPACGSNNSTDQRFCRKCGLNLEPSVKSLLEQFPASRREDLESRNRGLEKFGQIAFGGFVFVMAVALLGLIYAILDRMVFSGNNPLVGIILMTFVIFGVLSLAYVFFREDQKAKRQKSTDVATVIELPLPITTGRLLDESKFDPVPSVIENTTDLLPRESRKS